MNIPLKEPRSENDLSYICSLIDYTARKTKNRRRDVVNRMGRTVISHYYEFADVFHCENLEKVSDQIIEECSIPIGCFDNVADCRYHVPTYWDIGKVYKRLILKICQNEGGDFIDTLIRVYNSWISDKIDDYNTDMYYQTADYLYASWQAWEPVL